MSINMYPTNPFTLGYENRIVAFVDVMGFQNLLGNSEESKRALELYYATAMRYLNTKSSVYLSSAPDDDFKKLFVSDSIIISVKITDDHEENLLRLGRFISTVGQLQSRLACKASIWTRGAISIGNLHLDEILNVLVGQAFVNAYELEKIADYPRVIVDPKFLKAFKMNTNTFIGFMQKLEYRSYLLGPNQIPRNGLGAFETQAIQVDWFRHFYEESEPLDLFFNDLSERQHQSQGLFAKSQKLIRYMVESHLNHSELKYFEIRSDLEYRARYNNIVLNLSHLTSFISQSDQIS